MTAAGPAGGRPGRRLLAAIGLAILVAAGALGWRLLAPAPFAGPIVLISIDTLRADHLPVYGYRGVETPAIDALVRDGVVFDRAYAHSPQTLVSHTSILSGRLPFEHGVRDNVGFTVRPEERLLPSLLKPAGFTSAGIVSSYVLRKETGIGAGFDFFDSDLPPASGESAIGQIQRSGPASLEVAARWLAGRPDGRFFLFFHVFEPHKPYAPPERFARFGPYDGEIAAADDVVGRLLGILRDRRLYDGAVIVLLADHGEGLGDHGEQEHGLFLYNETVRVPLVVKLPRNVGAGRRVASVVQHIDLVPTLLDLAGIERPAALRGRSLRPLLDGRASSLPDATVYSEALYSRYHFGWSELHAMTTQRYRYVRAPHEELYDVQEDFAERRNLADRRPDLRAGLRASVDRLLAGSVIQAPGAVSEDDRRRLAALGYVGRSAAPSESGPSDERADPKDKVGVLETYRRASELAGERRFFEAIPLYRQILASDPGMADVWLQLAEVYARSGQDRAAADAFTKAIALNPGEPGALIALGGLLLRLGDYDRAAGHAEAALSGAPAQAHELLARIALARRDDATAQEQAALATAADPSLPLPLYVKGLLLYRQERFADALPLFMEAIAQAQKRTVQLSELHFHAGDTLARLERYPEAERELTEEVRLFPHNVQARASLAMLYVATGRPGEATRAVDAIVSAAPTPEGYALAIDLWNVFGDRARGEALARDAVQRFGPRWKAGLTPAPRGHE